MAESILCDIATEVLQKIGSLVVRQVSFLWNVESDLKSLEGTLSAVQVVLLDAELDAEDVLEEFELQACGREAVRQKRSTLTKHFSHGDTKLCGQEFLKLIVDNSRSVRSIVFPAAKKYGDESIVRSFIGKDISKFKYLRLLHLCDIFFEVLPDSIGTLRHLRYIDLAWNYSLKKLLESICELQNLQMLRIGGCSRLRKLHNNMQKMICLRLCEGMQGLKSLRMLHLRRTSMSSLPDTIKYLTKLEILLISYCPKINLKMDLQAQDRGLRLSLKTFIIYYLESLVDLPQLFLQASANTLKTMQIGYCKNLEALSEWFQYLASLETLDITNCLRLSSLPQGTERLTSLKLLKIENCPVLVESCRNDESKIAHIPQVQYL
ncbi:hypothetical protein Pint_16983 [Pistacia integerrima]|uniref:Uncharacterized protein n=1 Tax=Pistacia integerrima TaxID=434235 RepID=A0ACC0Z8D1_9ROSI|nr:hypothetical protein Pint_16983 [Pistacia integerrima]